MNDDTIRMAREANLLFPGTDHVDGSIEQLERFEALARAAEREACADAVRFADNGTEAAEIIRARGNT